MVQFVHKRDLNYQPFFADNPHYLADRAINESSSPSIGITYADLRGELTWDLRVDEIFLVLEGRLHVSSGDQSTTLEPEECVFCPRDTKVTLRAADGRVRYA